MDQRESTVIPGVQVRSERKGRACALPRGELYVLPRSEGLLVVLRGVGSCACARPFTQDPSHSECKVHIGETLSEERSGWEKNSVQ